VSARRLIALLVGLAIALAPFGMPAMAQAQVSSSHHGQMTGQAAGHCREHQAPSDHGKVADKDCCAAMCIAITLPAPFADLPAYHASRERPRSDIDRRGFIAEIATPPPRIS